MKFDNICDEDLVLLSLGSSDNADCALEEIFRRYKNSIYKMVRCYFLSNGDENDLVQEGMLGLFRAIKSYNSKNKFAPYALTCIKNSIFSAIKTSNAKKNLPLSDYISLSGTDEEDNDKNNFLSDIELNPENSFIKQEDEEELNKMLNKILSPLESKILKYYLNGFSYSDIAVKTNKNIKSVDNAIQRIRVKLIENK